VANLGSPVLRFRSGVMQGPRFAEKVIPVEVPLIAVSIDGSVTIIEELHPTITASLRWLEEKLTFPGSPLLVPGIPPPKPPAFYFTCLCLWINGRSPFEPECELYERGSSLVLCGQSNLRYGKGSYDGHAARRPAITEREGWRGCCNRSSHKGPNSLGKHVSWNFPLKRERTVSRDETQLRALTFSFTKHFLNATTSRVAVLRSSFRWYGIAGI
jgi:hypothetical protein